MAPPSSGTVIFTRRLILRAAHADDLPAYAKWLSDPESMRYWSHAAHTSIDQSKAFLDRMIESPWNGIAEFSICLAAHPEIIQRSKDAPTVDSKNAQDVDRSDDIVIGKAGLWDGVEVGFLFDREYWGKGYAYEALDAVVKHAWALELPACEPFSPSDQESPVANATEKLMPPKKVADVTMETIRIQKIKADVDPRNTGSLRVLDKLGFVEVGSAARTYETHIGWCDSVYLELARPSP